MSNKTLYPHNRKGHTILRLCT